MKKLSISVFLLLFQSILMITPPDRNLHINSTHANCYQSYQITLRGPRPAPNRVLPIQQGGPSFRDVIFLSRHHIIPYNILRDFYNRLATNEQHFRHFFDQVLVVAGSNAGVDLINLEDLSQLRRASLHRLPVALRDHVNANRNVNQASRETMAREVYTWLPFNIFIGPLPNYRSDDPGDNFEENAHVIVGQPRLEQLHRIQAQMIGYIRGDNPNPINLINDMGNLVRITLQPYSYETSHWRYNRRIDRYALATETIRANPEYRLLEDDDFCRNAQDLFLRYFPPDFSRGRRQVAKKEKSCLVRDDGAMFDRYCINSLNVLGELIKKNLVTLGDNEITLNSVDIPEGKEPTSQASDCHLGLGAAGGAAVGAVSGLGLCLIGGGLYFPVVGWVGCAAGSAAIYIVGGTVAGGTIALASCKIK